MADCEYAHQAAVVVDLADDPVSADSKRPQPAAIVSASERISVVSSKASYSSTGRVRPRADHGG